MHDKRGPLPVPAVPHALWQEQDQAEGNSEDIVRLAAVHGYESSAELDVFQGMLSGIDYVFMYSGSFKDIFRGEYSSNN